MKLNKLIMTMFAAFSITLTGCQDNEDEQLTTINFSSPQQPLRRKSCSRQEI